MSKYLKKTPEQLKHEKAEIEAAFEQVQKERAELLGPIFLRIIDSIDDATRAKAYFNILENNATKEEKKQLKSMLKSLKSMADSDKNTQESPVVDKKLSDNIGKASEKIS